MRVYLHARYVLRAAQVLAHYLMNDQLSDTANCCQQMALRGLRAIADDH